MIKTIRYSTLLVSVLSVLTLSAASALADGASIDSLSPGSEVTVNSSVTFHVTTTLSAPVTYSITDTAYSVTSSNIDSSGNFSWTPQVKDLGSHFLSIVATDGSGNTQFLAQELDVNPAPYIGIQGLSSPASINENTNVSFTIVPTSMNNPTYSISDSFSGTTVSASDLSGGNFSWTPADSDIGVHNLTITANDSSGNSATTTQTISVLSLVTPTPTPSDSDTPTPTPFPTDTPIWTPTPTPTPVPTPNLSATISSSLSTSTNFSTNIAPGSPADVVKSLQGLLNQLGFFKGPVNGLFGPLTKAAVTAFQAAHKLATVGTVGPQTRALLNQMLTDSMPTSTTTPTAGGFKFTKALIVGATGDEVTQLQKKLSADGFFSGPVNGKFGPLTLAAVKKFQTAHNLQPLGNVGPGTRAALNQ